MSAESAQEFVSRMKEDKGFRSAVQQVADAVELNNYLRGQGFEFDQRELVGAMAACMTELDSMARGCCQ
jgi:predicted ribosomally synthesized peptide with nif11-like leader